MSSGKHGCGSFSLSAGTKELAGGVGVSASTGSRERLPHSRQVSRLMQSGAAIAVPRSGLRLDQFDPDEIVLVGGLVARPAGHVDEHGILEIFDRVLDMR